MRIPLFPARGIRLRLTVLFGTVLGLTLLVFSLLVYGAFVREQDLQFDAALYNHAVDVANSIDVTPFGDVVFGNEHLSTSGKIFPFAVGKSFLQVLNRNGNPIARSRSLGNGKIPFNDSDRALVAAQGVVIRTIQGSELGLTPGKYDPHYRLINFLAQPHPLSGFVLQIAVSLKPMEQERAGIRTFFTIAIPATLLLAMMGALYMSGRALNPVAAIITKAEKISAHQLSERLPIPQDEDELRRLTLTLNNLLDRLERAFISQERFVADASHQLRTPLAILRGELDVLRKKPGRSAQEVEEFLDSATQEIDHLSRLVEELLLLARIEAGAGSLTMSACRMDEIAIDVSSKMERMAARKSVRLKLDLQQGSGAGGDFEVQGDEDLLHSALQNLVDNAIKYSPEGSLVEMRVSQLEKGVRVSIRDNGPGMSGVEQKRVFDRFFRGGDSSGSAGRTSGFGLGLAIASRIIEMHGSKLELESTPGVGSTFQFVLG
jgi:signal transduction histidine kinase